MTHQNPPEHFKGKTVAAHLRDARLKGASVSKESHSSELPGHFYAFTDSAKDTAAAFLLLFSASTAFPPLADHLFLIFITFGIGYTLWKAGRSALLGWGRLERLHRLIEEERWEIEHHRDQEREELREMYEAKGFSGKLLDEVVAILMADDNRLLQVMLEEELGLSLEVYEHPLKQAFGAALGALMTTLLCILSHYFWPFLGVPLASLLIVVIAANRTAHFERREQLPSVIWNFSLLLFSGLFVYFIARLLQ